MKTLDGTGEINLQIGGESVQVDRIDGQASIHYTYSDAELYRGEYEFTPSDEQQTVRIAEKKAQRDIVINPIPSNYGKIEWNGAYITVS